MASAAVRGGGTLLKIGDGGSPESFTTIAEVGDITGPSMSADTIEVTSQDSTGGFKEYIAGFKDGGELSAPMNFVNSAAQEALIDDFLASTKRNFQLVTTHGSPYTATFAGYITAIDHSFPINDKATRNVTIKITGAVGGLT